MTKTVSPREDIYTRVTARILADLEQGVRPWLKPWQAGHADGRIVRPLRANGVPYRGMNVLLLWGEAVARGYRSPMWMTYKQAEALDAQVRKGEKGALVVYASEYTAVDVDDQGEAHERAIPFMKGYTVFNVEQVDGLSARYYAAADPVAASPSMPRHAEAERLAASSGGVIRHGGDRAFYAPGPDLIQMPPFEAFRDPESYYATLTHELTHWTGHGTRLARRFDGGHRYGSEGYAFEELVAELGAAFLCADLGVTPEPREDHAAYLAGWLKVLGQDKRAIFSAAAHAQRAADFLHELRPRA